MKDVYYWLQPHRVVALRLIELLGLFSEHSENAASRIAGFEPVSERVRKNIVLRAFFVHFQGIFENLSEVRRFGSNVSVRHTGRMRN